MRKCKRRQRKRLRKTVIVSSLSLFFITTVGYAAFQTSLNINVKGNIKNYNAAWQLKKKVVNNGDGLYTDIYEEGRYVYKGANPDNYITFNNETWRIISIETDETIKIIRSESIGDMVWNPTDIHDWANPASLNTYLNTDYYNTFLQQSKEQIQTHVWNIGAVDASNLQTMIDSEKSKTWNGNVALISISDYYKANTNIEQCGDYFSERENYNGGICKTTNYMYQLIPTAAHNYVWMITPEACRTYVWHINGTKGYAVRDSPTHTIVGVLPVIYLKSDIKLSNDGTENKPYKIISN